MAANRFSGMEEERLRRAEEERQRESHRRAKEAEDARVEREANQRAYQRKIELNQRIDTQVIAMLNELADELGVAPSRNRVTARSDDKGVREWTLKLARWGRRAIVIRLGYNSVYDRQFTVDTMASQLPWDSLVPERLRAVLIADTGIYNVEVVSPKEERARERLRQSMEEQDRRTPVY